MKINLFIFISLIVGVSTLFIIFSQRGVLDVRTDTSVYLDQIAYFNGYSHQMSSNTQLRSFKPFYGFVGAFLTNFVNDEEAIALINIIFYFGLIITSFFFLRELGFKDLYATIGSSWITTGYPVMKYGLALLTDISGWFFAIATITLFLVGFRKQSTKIIILASMVGFIGSLCKETGVLGLLFSGIFLIFKFITERNKNYIKNLFYIFTPFILLQVIFLFIVFQKNGNGSSFIDWFLFNKNTIGYDLHTWYYFLLTEASAFNLLWVFSLYTIYSVLSKKIILHKEKVLLAVSLFIATLPPLIWPIFLTRVLYIEYLFVIPFALFGFFVLS